MTRRSCTVPRSGRPPQVRCGVRLLLALAAACHAGSMGAAEPPPLPCANNAAHFYWKAAALLQEPLTRDEFEMAAFAEKDLPGLAPRVLFLRLDAFRWLLRERPLLNALADASRCTQCDFMVRREDSPHLDLAHLPRMRAVVLRALAVGRAYQYAENAEGAALLHTLLLRLVEDLDKDNCLSSGLTAADLLQRIVSDMEAWFGRVPPPAAAVVVSRYFITAPSRLLHPSDYLREEAQRYGNWLLADTVRPEDRLDRLYGTAQRRPGVDRLVTLAPKKKQERMKGWVADYRRRVLALAEAMDQPFRDAMPALVKLDAQKEAIEKKAPKEDINPLVPLLVPTMADAYQRMILAEAQYDMAAILCSATLYRAETGSWPPDLASLGRFAGRILPKDPFTGEDFHYRLTRGGPVLTARVPKKLAQRPGVVFSLDPEGRARTEAERVTRYIRITQDRRTEDINASVPP